MKEPFSFEEGRIVQSIQGRDAKAYFVILNQLEDGFVAIADGDRHKLSHPKRKKTKHLSAESFGEVLFMIMIIPNRIQTSK